MRIINPEFIALFKDYPLRSQENSKDPLVIAKLFDIASQGTWYLTEFDPKTKVAFGFTSGLGFEEWGHIYLPLLETVMHCDIPRIKRSFTFVQKPISHFIKTQKRRTR